MITAIYKGLHDDAVKIRTAVFMDEQGFQNEFDDIDSEAVHLVLYREDGTPVGCCRFFSSDEADTYILGRLATLKEERGKKLGSLILQEAEKEVKKLGAKKMILHAQVRATPFYESNGYKSYGEIEMDEHVPHIWMEKRL